MQRIHPSHSLWNDHPYQRSLFNPEPPSPPEPPPPPEPPQPPPKKPPLSVRPDKPSQAGRLLTEFRRRRTLDEPLPLPEIMKMGIAQHGARLKELRDRGHKIDNEMWHMDDGSIHSQYRLVHDAERDGPAEVAS